MENAQNTGGRAEHNNQLMLLLEFEMEQLIKELEKEADIDAERFL